jgi:hypothetical protein
MGFEKAIHIRLGTLWGTGTGVGSWIRVPVKLTAEDRRSTLPYSVQNPHIASNFDIRIMRNENSKLIIAIAVLFMVNRECMENFEVDLVKTSLNSFVTAPSLS